MGLLAGIAAEIPPSAVALGLALGLVCVLFFWPLLIRFPPVLRYYGRIHWKPISDIPGVPEWYDASLCSALMTLPDPSNFISAYSYLSLKDGVAFTCRMPKCRYYSISLYAGIYDPVQDKIPPSLADHEIAHNADGSFDVVISETRPAPDTKGAENWLPSQGIRDGLLVIRRYGTLPGQLVDCPAFYRLSDGARLKPPHRTYSGSHYAQANDNTRFARLVRVLRFLSAAYLFLLFLVKMPLANVNVALGIAGLVPIGLNSLLYRVGRRRALAMRDAKTNGSIHRVIEPKLEFDATSARPHPAHKYFLIAFDARKGDVVIKGSIFPRQQKFWDLCVYSVYGLPNFQTFNDETITFASEKSSGDEGRGYQVVLTRDPGAWEGEPNVVDVSEHPEGVALVRLIFPASEEVFQRSKPEVEVLAPRAKGE